MIPIFETHLETDTKDFERSFSMEEMIFEKRDLKMLRLLETFDGEWEAEEEEQRAIFSKNAYRSDAEQKFFVKRSKKDKPKKRARDFAESLGKGIPVISRQYVGSKTGKKAFRDFSVTSWTRFYEKTYVKCEPEEKTFYENVYGSDPCLLYIDVDREDEALESEDEEKTKNLLKSANLQVFRMCASLCFVLRALYSLEISEFIVLDSSKGKKISKHVLFRFCEETVFFKSTHELHRLFSFLKFASIACSEPSKNDDSDFRFPLEENPFFWKKSNENSDFSFIPDMSVYGNVCREMRLLGSTKTGQNRHLKFEYSARYDPSRLNVENVVDFSIERRNSSFFDYEDFKKCLIFYCEEGKSIERCLTFRISQRCEKGLKPKKGSKGEKRSDKAAFSFRCDFQKTKFESLMKKIETEGCENDESALRSYEALKNGSALEKLNVFLEKCILDHCHPMAKDDDISMIKYEMTEEGRYLVYASSGKYCEIKGDEHSNNHVYWVVSLYDKVFYQKCPSPSCLEKISKIKKRKRMDREESRSNDFDDRFRKSCKSVEKIVDAEIWTEIEFFLEHEKNIFHHFSSKSLSSLFPNLDFEIEKTMETKKDSEPMMVEPDSFCKVVDFEKKAKVDFDSLDLVCDSRFLTGKQCSKLKTEEEVFKRLVR